MATFDDTKIQSLILTIEGAYSNNSNDLGGETKYGISKRQYPNLDIKNLSIIDALKIYRTDYWDKNNLSNIENQELADQIFLIVINMAPISYGLCLQKAIIKCGGVVALDGVFGTRTISALNSAPQGWLMDRIRIECIKFYLKRVLDDRKQLENLEGWVARAVR